MTARRSAGLLAIVAGAMVALAACTTIPSAGPVNEGSGVVSSSEPFAPFAEGPRVDAGPLSIVSGFVNATTAGFASDFTVAREFLTPDAGGTWDPNAQVIVYDSGALTTSFDDETNTVTYDIPVLATLDDSGRLTEAAGGARQTVTFHMARDQDGQWRIASLDNGAILAGATFERLFAQVVLQFASVDQTTQVPELRWLPQNKSKVATLAARELVQGPSDWLAPAVVTGLPPASSLEVDSVVVTEGVAAVQLTAESAGTAAERSLAQQQLALTLASIPGVTAVSVTVGGLPLGGDDSANLEPAPLPGTEAAGFVGDRLGLWDGQDLWRVRPPVGALPAGSGGLAQSFDGTSAAWVVGGKELVVSQALTNGVASLEPASEDAEPGPGMETGSLYTGTSLVSPSWDRHGWVWTTERNGSGSFVAVKPDGTATQVAVDWLRGTTVQALAVSRDGARVAVLSRAGGKQVLEVASIVRGADGTPLTIGRPLPVGADLGPAIDVAWVDDLTVAVLGEGANDLPSDLWLAEVGGLTVAQKAVPGAAGITARQGERTLIVVDSDHRVYSRSGTVWSQVADGVGELAYAG